MIEKLHYITQEGQAGESHSEMARQACEAGVKWVQLRVKDTTYEAYKKIALETQKICATFSATFILNDNVELAAEINADGVHLGKSDLPVVEARKILGASKIIGGTANTKDDVTTLIEQGVDYIGLGPFQYTPTKKKLSPVLGTKGYADIVQHLSGPEKEIPIIAIGGISDEHINDLLSTGVHGVAIASQINHSNSKKTTVESFTKLLNHA